MQEGYTAFSFTCTTFDCGSAKTLTWTSPRKKVLVKDKKHPHYWWHLKRGYLSAKASQMLRSWPTSRPRVNGILATVCLGVLGFFLYVTYRHGQDSYVRIHDNLDLVISWYRVLKDSRTFWAPLDATVPQIFNGLPRNSMVSSLIIFPSFFMFLDTLHAYILTEVIARLTGYVGMVLLLRKHILGEKQNLISHFVALVFSLVPLSHFLYLTVMGQPLLLYAFLNLRQRRNSIHSWLILGFFPFCSHLAAGGFAIVIGMAGFVVWDWIDKRKLNFDLMWAVALVTLCYAIVEYRLVYQSFFDRSYVSHRTAWAPRGTPYHDILPEMLTYFARGWYHIETLQIPIVVAVPLCVARRMILLRGTMFVPPNHLRILLSLLSVTVLTAIIRVVFQAELMVPAREAVTILKTFNWGRIAFIDPVLKYILFAVGLSFLARLHFVGRFLVAVLLVLQVGYCFWYTTYFERWRNENVTFAQFYGESLFGEIRDYIGEPQENYRVGSIGFHPSISQYNGFYTLDGYAPDYPLSYKEEFRKIIAPALDKNPGWRSYFDDWGNRVYLYGSLNTETVRSELNMGHFKAMGGKFLFSAWRIENAEDIGLTFRQLFQSDGFAWPVYLYEVR